MGETFTVRGLRFLTINEGPEAPIEGIAEEMFGGGLETIGALDAAEGAGSGIEEVCKPGDGGVGAEIEAAGTAGGEVKFGFGNGSKDLGIAGFPAGVKDRVVEAAAGEGHGEDGGAQDVFEGEPGDT